MEFSDESDTEDNTHEKPKEKPDVAKKRSTARKAASNSKAVKDPPREKVLPKRQTKSKESTALRRVSSSEDDTALVCQAASTRRGRTRRNVSKAEADSVEEPDKMRTIEVEVIEVLNMSMERLRTSDTETEESGTLRENISVYFLQYFETDV